jgi:hypothetical protein
MESRCEVCGLRERAKIKPNSLIVRLWRWHTTWCPGWKAYQEELAKRQAEAGAEPSKTV